MAKRKDNLLGYTLLVIILLMVIIIPISLVNNSKIVEQQTIPVSFIISDTTGFDLNNSMLSFGKILPGGVSSRSITIQNNWNTQSRIVIESYGVMTDFLVVSENSFILKPNETKKIGFSVLIPKNSSLKEYNGIIKIKMLVP